MRAAAAVQVANLTSTPINPSVQAVGLAGLAYVIALFRFGFFTQVPIAAQIVFERMTDAVVVLNPEGRVADLNREAERRLGIRRAGGLRPARCARWTRCWAGFRTSPGVRTPTCAAC